MKLNNATGNSIAGDGVVGTNDILVNTGGTLQLAAAAQIADDATVQLNGGTWNLSGFNETILSLGGNFATTIPTLTLGGGTLTLNRIDWDNTGTVNSKSLGDAGTLRFVAAGATQAVFEANYVGTFAVTPAVLIDAASLSFRSATYGTILSGKVSGAGKLIFDPTGGAGGLTLTNGANDYSGGTQWTADPGINGAWDLFTVSASGALGSGDVTIQGGNQNTWVMGFVGSPTAFVFNSNTTQTNHFILSGDATISVGSAANANPSSDRVTLSGAFDLGSHTLYIRGPGTGTISSTISGTGGITKIDTPGTWVLTGNNTYTGTTTVSAGLLQVGSAGAGQTGTGNVTVQNGGTLLGTGLIQGPNFTAASGSILHAGDSTASSSLGTLNFTPVTGGGTQSLGGQIILDIATANNTGGVDPTFGGNAIGSIGYIAYVNDSSRSQGLGSGSHDLLAFNTAADASGYNLTATGTLQVRSSGFSAAYGQIYNLLDWSSLVTTNFTGFDVGTNYRDGSDDDASQFNLPTLSGGLVWDVSQFTTSGIIVVVPEPGRALLLLLGFVALISRRRQGHVQIQPRN